MDRETSERSGDGPRRRSILQDLRSAYADAVLAGDPVAAELIVQDAIAVGISQPVIDEEIIAPAMRRVGELWARGEISVADEHLATEISFRVLGLRREAFRLHAQRARHRVLLAAVEGERHVLGLTMAGSLLAEAGYDARVIGPDVPLAALRPIALRQEPRVFGFTASMAGTAELLQPAIDEVQGALPSLGVVVGGMGVPAEMRATPSVAVCRKVSAVVETVDALVQRPHMS